MTREEKLQDIRENSDRHRHVDMNELHACCFVDGALDMGLIEAHEGTVPQRNPGGRCDVLSGPCACGA